MVARLIGELGVDVDDVEPAQRRKGAPGRKDLVQDLRVALEDVRVALGLREKGQQAAQLATLQDVRRRRRTRSR